MKKYLGFVLTILLFAGCNVNSYDLQYEHEGVIYMNNSELPELSRQNDFYVPAYSDIYYETMTNRTYLTVILSLRNISFSDTLYFDKIEYYSSNGELLRQYIDKVLLLRPMESMEFIVETAEREGGSGANFVVGYKAKEDFKNKPLIETIMMGNLDNYRFSFSSRGIEINN